VTLTVVQKFVYPVLMLGARHFCSKQSGHRGSLITLRQVLCNIVLCSALPRQFRPYPRTLAYVEWFTLLDFYLNTFIYVETFCISRASTITYINHPLSLAMNTS
jgi:hypothetical protein